jgi:pimeloyl-ACP methyl ester carboxylesterase
MRPCYTIEIQTPKKYLLNGLWFGPKKPKRLIVWVHGLGSSAFTKHYIVDQLIDEDTAVMTFNNRGFEMVSDVRRLVGKKTRWSLGGAAHEVFTDSADDIQGAVDFAKRAGVKNIYLAGHSTGCQKSMYWASTHKEEKNVKGIILLAPISDYSSDIKKYGKTRMEKIARIARQMVKAGKAHELLPLPMPAGFYYDAQRVLSLFTLESVENIFSYANPEKDPKILKSVRLPILVLLAEKDEYGDMSATKIGEWFQENLKSTHAIQIIPKVTHGFKGAEREVAKIMKKFISSS